jgi:hypothetical protein
MTENHYSRKDVEKMILSHPLYCDVVGSYVLSQNTTFATSSSKKFICSEDEFQNFVAEILKSILLLKSVKAHAAPQEWAPLPGVEKAEVLRRFQEATNLYKELLQEDPHIVAITKVSDKGRSVTWKE